MIALLAIASAKPDPAQSAEMLVETEGGFEVTAVTPLDGKPGWFTWTGSKGGEPCQGSVEVTRAHKKKPRGRFSAACDKPTAEAREPVTTGTFTATEDCGPNAAGVPVTVTWSLTLAGGAFELAGDGYQTLYRAWGSAKSGPPVELVVEDAEEGTTLPPDALGRAAFLLEPREIGFVATPGTIVLGCRESLTFAPDPGPR
ncbi:MAG: hypothetical protein KC656_07675 [Myxococcales bacterium]|nr:hypothetical protein [Myxococcales bacterium]